MRRASGPVVHLGDCSILRAFLGTTSLMSQFYALRHMPLADASVIIFSVPVFVAIFARIFLKVRVRCGTAVCLFFLLNSSSTALAGRQLGRC